MLMFTVGCNVLAASSSHAQEVFAAISIASVLMVTIYAMGAYLAQPWMNDKDAMTGIHFLIPRLCTCVYFLRSCQRGKLQSIRHNGCCGVGKA
jgi:hypothetical protein